MGFYFFQQALWHAFSLPEKCEHEPKTKYMTLIFWITLLTFGLAIFWALFKSIDFFAEI